MFCPKCGQEQATESVRFCSRCGFKLGATEPGLAKRLVTMAMYLFITICAMFGWASLTSGPAYMQVRVFITIVAAITFYLLFFNDLTHIFNRLLFRNIDQKTRIAAASEQSVLPPAQSIPLPALRSPRVNTAEMLQPPSVTEHTTMSLDRNKN